MYCSRQSLASQENDSPASELGALTSSNLTSTNLSRPDSSSSTSSVTDWESGLSTVRRQPTTSKACGLGAPSSRKVEEISAFRSRSRFQPALVEEDSSSTKVGSGSTRSGSLDKLDRLSVRSELSKATPLLVPVPVSVAANAPPPPSHGVQALRRRHRSVERQLDSADDSSGSRERFSAAVFAHKPTKLMAKTPPSMKVTLKPNRMLLKSTIEALSSVNTADQEMDTSSTIYSLRPGEDMSGVQLSNSGSRSIQDHIIATQMNRLNREIPISDVYHERNMGLGLAPPLSELLVSSASASVSITPASASSDDVFNSFDQISLADTVTELSDKTLKKMTYAKRPPPGRPSKMHPSAWSTAAGYRHRTSFDTLTSDSEMSLTLRQGTLDMTRRDEADGRSMTDSNYSGYSPHRNLKLSTVLPSLSRHTLLDAEDKKIPAAEKSNTIRAVAVIEADAKVTISDAASLC